MLYQMNGLFKPMKVEHFCHFGNSQAKYLMLRWIAMHADHAEEVRLQASKSLRLETLALDLRPTFDVSGSPSHTGGMARIISVLGLSGIPLNHIFGKNLRFVANIEDGQCPWNVGVFSFEEDAGKLKVQKLENHSNGDEPSFSMKIQGLAHIVYNGAPSIDMKILDWGNPPSDVQKIIDEMFPAETTYLFQYF
uniref:Predicted protein n=1 Tax=Hordeum vulgare subsp. vulgare TaxID=112509 RepID=F2DMJ4_HORVV|nr:predicted protein [Hordeum vulgare subsp. vulgare]